MQRVDNDLIEGSYIVHFDRSSSWHTKFDEAPTKGAAKQLVVEQLAQLGINASQITHIFKVALRGFALREVTKEQASRLQSMTSQGWKVQQDRMQHIPKPPKPDIM
ncbi:MAG: hypothetical protein MHM6MM_000994 [Cercozoa sp. M6MM]